MTQERYIGARADWAVMRKAGRIQTIRKGPVEARQCPSSHAGSDCVENTGCASSAHLLPLPSTGRREPVLSTPTPDAQRSTRHSARSHAGGASDGRRSPRAMADNGRDSRVSLSEHAGADRGTRRRIVHRAHIRTPMTSSLRSAPPRSWLRRRSNQVLVYSLAVVVPVSACAQQPAPIAKPKYDFRANLMVEGQLGRSICEDQLRLGDTVSATVVPARFAYDEPTTWPNQFDVLLRRDVPPKALRPGVIFLTAIRATIDGTTINGTIGEFRPDPEGVHYEHGRMEVDCFVRGATLVGGLTHRLIVR